MEEWKGGRFALARPKSAIRPKQMMGLPLSCKHDAGFLSGFTITLIVHSLDSSLFRQFITRFFSNAAMYQKILD